MATATYIQASVIGLGVRTGGGGGGNAAQFLPSTCPKVFLGPG